MSCMPLTDQNVHMLMLHCVVHQQMSFDCKIQECINRYHSTTKKTKGMQANALKNHIFADASTDRSIRSDCIA